MGETRSTDEFARLLKKGLNEIKILENKNLELIQDELGYAIGREGGSCIEHWKRGHTPKSSEELEKLGREIVKRSRLKEDWLQRFLFHGGHPHYQHPQILYSNTPDLEFDEPAYSFTETSTLTKNRTISYMVYVITGITFVAVFTSFLLFNINPEAFTSFFSLSTPTPTNTPTPTIESNIFVPTIAPTPTLSPLALQAGGFEGTSAEIWAYWQSKPGCNLRTIQDPNIAKSGEYYLVANGNKQQCFSFSQNLRGIVKPDGTYTFSIWGRTETDIPKRVEMVIWLLNTGQMINPKSFTFFDLNSTWQCLETSFSIPQGVHSNDLVVELFMHSEDEGQIYFDDAAFHDETTSSPCSIPKINLQPASPLPLYSGSEFGFFINIQNNRPFVLGEGTIEAWIAKYDDEAKTPLYDPLLIETSLLNANALFSTYKKLNIPLGFEPGTYHVMAQAFFNGKKISLDPILITVNGCEKGVPYCDVPANHWAFSEIKIWGEKRLTNGCKSQTELYNNRPFCPNSLLERWMLAVFLLRYLQGPDYKPPVVTEFYFTDIVDHGERDWLENFRRLGIELAPTTRCPYTPLRPQFCPNIFMTRGEVAQSLAQLYNWPVPETSDMPFTDVPADHPAYNALTYMWQTGLLPDNDPHCPADDNGPRFCPDDPISRDSAVVLLVRFLPELELPAATPTP